MANDNNQNKESLFKEMRALAKKANQRILRLERMFGTDFKGRSKSIGINRLKDKLSIDKLQAWSEKGRVRVSKNYSEMQMTAIISALNQFNRSKYTTKRGLKDIKKKSIEGVQGLMGVNLKRTPSLEEAQSLYYLFEDREVNRITNYIEGSDLIPLVTLAKESNFTYEKFRQGAEEIIKYNKGNVAENLLKKVYLKYINKKEHLSKEEKIELTNGYIIDLINSAKWSEDIEDIKQIIAISSEERLLNNRESYYLYQKLKEKEREILEGF